jgi:hypothetical protein
MGISKRTIIVLISAFLLLAGMPISKSDASCVSTGSSRRCPHPDRGGFGGGGGGGGGGSAGPTVISIGNRTRDEGTTPPSEGGFGRTNFVFNVVRKGTVSGASSVHYATSPGSATENVDYDGKTGTVNFGAGQTVKKVIIKVVADNQFECGSPPAAGVPQCSDVFFVELSEPKHAKIGDGSGQGTIVNDDTGD